MQTSLEVSSNLVDWVGFTSLNITTNTGWTTLQHTNASGSGAKFYRAVLR